MADDELPMLEARLAELADLLVGVRCGSSCARCSNPRQARPANSNAPVDGRERLLNFYYHRAA